MSLTTDQIQIGHRRFLESNAAARRAVEGISEARAGALGMSLDDLRFTETQKLVEGEAQSIGQEPFEYLLELAIDSPAERAAILADRVNSRQRALGLE